MAAELAATKTEVQSRMALLEAGVASIKAFDTQVRANAELLHMPVIRMSIGPP